MDAATILASRCIFAIFVFITLMAQVQCQQYDSIDLCKTNPCANDGLCVQTSTSPGYKCQCHGTGYYGPRCKQVCPLSGTSLAGRRGPYPIECIVI